jgi:serine protease Do
MLRPWLALLLLLVPSALFAEDISAWAREKVREHGAPARAPAEPLKPSGKLWRERPANFPVPEFIAPTSLAPLVKAVRPGVVNVATTNQGASRSLGSGFLINPQGLVVTNSHVVERAQSIRVRLADGRELDATVIGRDASTDLALLRLTGEGVGSLPTVFLGDSDQLEVGDWVVAIGNPFGLDTSVTHGLISARERVIGVGPFDDFIQTNALINPGNSGGPLFNMRGEVVGVTTAIVTQGQGIGFAVPINLVKDLLPNLLDNGRAERGWLGVNIQEVGDGSNKAAVVTDVYKNSPASRAGLQAGDRVVGVGGRAVESYLQLLRRIALLAPGTTVKLSLQRGKSAFEANVTLTGRPSGDVLATVAGGGKIDSLGVVLRELPAALARQQNLEGGLWVEAVLPSSPAELSGLQVGDVLTEVNKKKVTALAQLGEALALGGAGQPVLVRYQRGEAARYVAIKPRD